MRLAETQEAEVSKVVVHKDDPEAIRVMYVGMEPNMDGLDAKHPDYKPTGELLRGDMGWAKPIHAEHPGFIWYFTSDRGFSMTVPPQDLRKDPAEERHKIRSME